MYIGRSSAYRENYASEEAAYAGFVSENDSIRIINGQVAGTRLNDTSATFLNPVGAGRGIEYGAWKALTDTRFEQYDRDIAAGKHAYIVDEEMGTFLGQLERNNPRMARYFEKQLEERGIIRANTGADDAFAYGGFYSGVQTQSGQLAAEQAQRELASAWLCGWPGRKAAQSSWLQLSKPPLPEEPPGGVIFFKKSGEKRLHLPIVILPRQAISSLPVKMLTSYGLLPKA